MNASLRPNRRARIKAFLRTELHDLVTIKASDRPWRMPLAAALCTAAPLWVGAYFERLDYGVVASLGGAAFLYLPRTPLRPRMALVSICALVLIACYAVGLASTFASVLRVPALMGVATGATLLCRCCGIGPPGGLFFVMVASIGAHTPATAAMLPRLIGLVALGALLACIVAYFYSVRELARRPAEPVKPEEPAAPSTQATFDGAMFDSVVIGGCVGLALALAYALRLERAYWVPVACIAVLQGATLRAVWTRQVHRVLGTGLGLIVTWGLLLLPLEKWSIGACVFVLMFLIEVAIVRHYAFATIFITPLSILLAEAATYGQPISTHALIQARFLDTVLGAFVGFIGGVCLHRPRLRAALAAPLRWTAWR